MEPYVLIVRYVYNILQQIQETKNRKALQKNGAEQKKSNRSKIKEDKQKEEAYLKAERDQKMLSTLRKSFKMPLPHLQQNNWNILASTK